MIETQDLRAAVQRGLITEAQAAALTGLADARVQARTQVADGEEPFVLFKGFNEIFIVIGLTILFGGWVALATVFTTDWLNPQGGKPEVFALIAVVTLAGLAVVQRYFTIRRRMIAPSIALSIMAALTAALLGWTIAEMAGLRDLAAQAVSALTVAGVMAWHFRVFRVPFAVGILVMSIFVALWALLALAGLVPADGPNLLHMSKDGPLAVLSIVFGLVCFGFAMRFDMSDPHRISTRATTGFWLHVVAAPAIVNTVAMRLLDGGQTGQFVLMLVLLALAVVAIVIDRRSFLVSGAGYAVWLIYSLFDGSPLIVVFLGLGLVLLGAQWERLRSGIMRALPDFPGKTRLPPYGALA